MLKNLFTYIANNSQLTQLKFCPDFLLGLQSTWHYECFEALINQKIEFYKLTNQKMFQSIRSAKWTAAWKIQSEQHWNIIILERARALVSWN